MVCGQANCYSNCDIDYKGSIPLDLRGCFRGSCDKCPHDLWNHHRCCAIWERVIDVQVLFDNNVKEKWESAKDRKEKEKALADLREKVLGDLNQAINRATRELAELVEQYADLSLSGSFSDQVDKTVRLLEQKHTALQGQNDNQDQLQTVEESLDRMKKKNRLLNTTKEKENARKGSFKSKVKGWLGFS